MSRSKLDIENLVKGFERAKIVIPIILAKDTQSHFLKGFENGGGQTDDSLGGWTERKRPNSRANRGRALLVKIGSMKNDLQDREISFHRIVVNILNIEYAQYHNFGMGHMPRREIIGDSKELEAQNLKTIQDELDKINP